MSKKSRWLDGIPVEKKRAKTALSQTDRTDMGTVTEIMGEGNVAVHIDDSSDPDVVAPVAAGVTGLGARVRLTRDSAGKVTQVEAPDRLPEGADPVFVGVTGETVGRIADAQGELDSAIAGAAADAAAAQSAAQSAANDAAAAMVDAANASAEASAVSGVAEAANDAAAAAQSAAGEAITVASTKTSVKASKTSPDSPMTNDLWFPLDVAGNVIGMKQWTGSSWVDYRLMAGSIVVPGSVGNVLLENGAVSAEKIFANEALWAKIATFASVTTDMLLAGGATITGELLADTIQLATRLVAGDPAGDRAELNGAGINIFKGGVERVRLAASAPNGLQVWNPSMAAMVDLSAAAFGAQILTHNPKLNIPVPGSQSAWGEWKPGAWVFQSLGRWTATTDRAQIFSTTSLGDAGVAQSFGVQIAFTMQPVGGGTEIALTDTGGEYGAVVQRSSPNPNFGIVSCTPGNMYNVRLQSRAIRYVSSPGGTPWIKNSQISLTPI